MEAENSAFTAALAASVREALVDFSAEVGNDWACSAAIAKPEMNNPVAVCWSSPIDFITGSGRK